jgi:hypothetical protein
VGDSPRFRAGFGLPQEPFHRSLKIEGQRNVTLQVLYTFIDYDFFLRILKTTLTAILAALALSVFALIIEIALKKRSPSLAVNAPSPKPQDHGDSLNRGDLENHGVSENHSISENHGDSEKLNDFENLNDFEDHGDSLNRSDFENHGDSGNRSENVDQEPDFDDEAPPTFPNGLYSPRSNVGWEAYIHNRLASELQRCAFSNQDIVFLNMEYKDGNNADLYRELADEAVKFFTLRDLIFEKGEWALAVIIPGIDIEQGSAKAEEFHMRIQAAGISSSSLHIGLSSRSGRDVEANRLVFEAAEALRKSLGDPAPSIVAFKSDPKKYREFIQSR